jgi:hypothetical protein
VITFRRQQTTGQLRALLRLDAEQHGHLAAAEHAGPPGTCDILYRWSGNPDLPPAAVPRNGHHALGCTRFAGP